MVPISSEEASASESGVERRTPGLVFSRITEAVAAAGGVEDGAIEIGLLDGADICLLYTSDAADEMD